MPVKFPDRPIDKGPPAPPAPAPKPDGSHISPEVRADLGKLTPELAAGVRRVADSR
jgi:hypothetical protein